MGSRTTLVVARKNKRKAIGIEISEKYCEIVVERLGGKIISTPVEAVRMGDNYSLFTK